MSSSRSDVVTQLFRVSVFSFLFFLSVSLKFLLVLKSFNGISRLFKVCLKFQGSFRDVSRKLGCLQKVLRVFPGSLKGVSRKFQECYKKVSRVFRGSFRKYQGCFKKVSWVFQLWLTGVSRSFKWGSRVFERGLLKVCQRSCNGGSFKEVSKKFQECLKKFQYDK